MNHNKLSADPTSLVLGIIALVLGITGCCCYGIPAVITLAMAIIGLVIANKSIKEYNANPDAYSPQSRSNVGTAKIINIIAVVFNGLIVLSVIIVFAIYGTLMSTAFLEGIRSGGTYEYNDYDDYEWDTDSTDTWNDDDYIIDEERDSINIDSLREQNIEVEEMN